MKTAANPDYYDLSSERIQFRKLTDSDKELWQTFFENNNHLRFLAQDPDLGKEFLSNRWINFQLDRYQNSSFGLLGLIDKVSGEFIGQAGLLTRELDGQPEMEIAYSLIPKFWRQGYATEAVICLKNYAKKQQLAKRLISIIHHENMGSIAVAKKHGFIKLFETTYMEMPVHVYGEK